MKMALSTQFSLRRPQGSRHYSHRPRMNGNLFHYQMLQCAKIGVTQIVPLVGPVYGARCISIFATTKRLRARQQANVRSKALAVAQVNETVVYCQRRNQANRIYVKSTVMILTLISDSDDLEDFPKLLLTLIKTKVCSDWYHLMREEMRGVFV